MPLSSFKDIPRNLVEWGKFFRSVQVTPDDGSVGSDQLQDGSVLLQKLQDITPDRLLGRDTAPAGTAQELTVSGGLEFTGGGIQRSALTGDVTAAASSNATTIADNVVTYAKMQNVSATDRILGRQSVGAGDVEEITCTAAGRALLDDADATAQRSTLGLGTAATQNIGALTTPPGLPSYTVATVPSASPAGQLIYVSNESGGAVVAFSDATNWRRVTDRAVVS